MYEWTDLTPPVGVPRLGRCGHECDIVCVPSTIALFLVSDTCDPPYVFYYFLRESSGTPRLNGQESFHVTNTEWERKFLGVRLNPQCYGPRLRPEVGKISRLWFRNVQVTRSQRNRHFTIVITIDSIWTRLHIL